MTGAGENPRAKTRLAGSLLRDRRVGTTDDAAGLSRQMGCKRPVVSSTDGEDVASGEVRPASAPERELLWTVTSHSRRIMCQLRYHGKYGVEYRLFCDNEF